jgi:hypothetical protein
MMRVESLKDSVDGLRHLLSHHVKYEVDMLRAAYVFLLNPYLGDVAGNVFIEAFCIHARNLIDLFSERKELEAAEYAAAKHFANPGYEPFSRSNIGQLYGKLNEQIAHLTFTRPRSDDVKIKATDRTHLMKLIESELQRFAADLKDEYAGLWPEGFLPQHDVVTGMQAAQGTSTLTGSFQPYGATGSTGPAGPTGPTGS